MDKKARQRELLRLLRDSEDRLGQLNRDDPRFAHLTNVTNQLDGALQEYLEVSHGSGS